MIAQIGEHFRREQVGHDDGIHRMAVQEICQGAAGVAIGEIHGGTPGETAIGISHGVDGPESAGSGLGHGDVGVVHPLGQLPAPQVKGVHCRDAVAPAEKFFLHGCRGGIVPTPGAAG